MRRPGKSTRESRHSQRRRILITTGLFAPFLAHANPVIIDPGSLIAFGIVALAAFMVEAGLVALLLTFEGLNPVRMLVAYFTCNGLIFFFIFQPLLEREWSVPLLELLVVLMDAALIKILANVEMLQRNSYSGTGWLRAIAISTAGNAVSYFVGYMASHRPWEQ